MSQWLGVWVDGLVGWLVGGLVSAHLNDFYLGIYAALRVAQSESVGWLVPRREAGNF